MISCCDNGHIDLGKLNADERALYNSMRPRWRQIYARCENRHNKDYANYGGRGIKMCKEWRDNDRGFACFFMWMMENGFKAGKDLQIDRIDNNGWYSPDNCRVVTRRENANNTRRNVFVVSPFLGGEIHTVSQWALIHGVKRSKIDRWIRHGRDVGKPYHPAYQMEFSFV